MDTQLENDPTDRILKQDEHLVHSFSDLHSLSEADARTVISQAEGAYIYNARGDRFIDGMAGLWCVNVGHGRKEIVDAVASQLQTLDYFSTFYNLTHPTAAELAEKIASMTPAGLDYVYFGNSGSVANDTAVRVIHHYFNVLGKPRKKKILSRIGAYHGSTHLAIAMTTPAYRQHWDSADELVHFLSSPCPYRRPDNMTVAEYGDFLIDEMRRDIEKIGADRIACMIAEPIMGAGGVLVAPEGYHQRALALCHENDILYISDEVVTAFGRLGHMFASESVFNIKPDVICSAKGLSSGYQPISATIFSEEIYSVVAGKDNRFLHGMTYSGHPACCAAALANIAIMENDGLCQHVQTAGPVFEHAIRDLNDLPIIGDVRGSHFMMGVEFVADKVSKVPFDDDVMVGARVANHAQRRGLMVRSLGSMIVLSPPLILDNTLIGTIADTLRESVEATVQDLQSEGLMT